MTIKKQGNNPILTSKLYILFQFFTPSIQPFRTGLIFLQQLKRGALYLTSKLYILFCFLTHLNESDSNFQNRAHFFQDKWKKNTDEFSCVCKICLKWYFCSDKYIKICIYAHIFYDAHLHGYGTFIRICMHMSTCLGTKIFSHIYIKRTYVYTHWCIYPCVYLYISICIYEDLAMLKHTWMLA